MNAGKIGTESLVLRRAELDGPQHDEMFALLAQHFEGVTRRQFENDLAGKSHVIMVRREERLVGFSTLLAYETSYAREAVSVIYSGDTIVAPEAWGTTALPRAWIAAVNELRHDHPQGRYYWLLLTSGFRTYRFLPVFWRDFLPRFDAVERAEARQLLDHLAAERFGDQFNARTGVVCFTQPQMLRSQLRGIPPERMADPHVNFFSLRNPGHVQGDELVCLTELSSENLTAAGRRMVGRNEHSGITG
jgi:hypothetical protein